MESKKLSLFEGWFSIVVNTFLFCLKYWAGIVTGSIALIADAWHTISDSVSSIVLIFGVKISEKSADGDHPFGHGRAEYIATLIISVLLTLIAFNFIKESFYKLFNRESVVFGSVAIIVTIISILVKEILAQFAFWAARKTGSNILKADGWHHRSDAISSLIILIGIFFDKYFWWVDGVLGIIVGLLILYAAYEIFRDSVHPLLGKKAGKKLINEINEICYEIGGKGFVAHHFHIHDYGKHVELTFHLTFPAGESIENAHSIATNIEKKIRDDLNIEATIHMEPE